jgi:hypothetical protein
MPMLRMVVRIVSPSTPGSMRSSVMTSYSSLMARAMPSRPLATQSTVKPRLFSSPTISLAVISSSSIVSTRDMMISRVAANSANLSGVRDWLSVKVHDAIFGLQVERVEFGTGGARGAAAWVGSAMFTGYARVCNCHASASLKNI